MKIVKFGTLALEEEKVAKLYEEKKYICTHKAIYQIMYSNAQCRFYGSKLFSIGLAVKGRYHAMTAAEINKIQGQDLLREDIY